VDQKKSIQPTANFGCVNVAAGCNKGQSKNISQFARVGFLLAVKDYFMKDQKRSMLQIVRNGFAIVA
jgi:hypothetical protein